MVAAQHSYRSKVRVVESYRANCLARPRFSLSLDELGPVASYWRYRVILFKYRALHSRSGFPLTSMVDRGPTAKSSNGLAVEMSRNAVQM